MTAITVSRVSLPSGCCHVGLRPCLITTTLGSCVAVCLYDPVSALGGMNHFVLPRAPAGSGRDARFGDVAIGELVTKLEASGCRIADLTAKMFGGANAMWSDTDSLFATGPRNVALAREELTRDWGWTCAPRSNWPEDDELLCPTCAKEEAGGERRPRLP